MKKNLLFAAFIFAMGVSGIAQTGSSLRGKLKPVAPKLSLPAEGTDRNMTCGNDTLYYPYLKEVLVSAAAPNFGGIGLMTGSASYGSAYAQAYLSTTATTINGVSFWGYVNDAVNPSQTLTVNVSVYNVNASNMPTTLIATTTKTLVGTVDQFYNVNFASPATASGNYAVVIQNPSTTDTLGIVVNDAMTSTYGEGLATMQYSGTWYSIGTLFGATVAYEAVIAPIVSYPIATNYTTSANPVCLGTPITFSNTTTPNPILGNRMYNFNKFSAYWALASSDSTYVWDLGDASALVWSANTTKNYSAAGMYNVTLTTLAGLWNSCVDSKTTAVTVNATPVLMITNPSPACAPASIDLTAAAVTAGSTGGGTLTYWMNAGATTPLSSPASVNAAGTYYIQAANGSCTDLDPVTVTINVTPVLSITNPAAVCAPGTVDITASAVTAGSTGGGTLSYWTDAGATSSLASPSMVASGGTYYIQSANGSCMDLDPVTVTVNPMDDATITAPTGMICTSDAAFNLSAATSGGTWSGTGITNASAGTFDPAVAGNGTFTISYMTAGTCPATGTATLTVSVCMGVQNIDAAAAVNVYPNPSNGVVNITLGTAVKSTVRVYNVIGAEVVAKEFNAQTASVDLSAFEAGVYFVKVTTDNGQVTKQITLTK